MNYSINLKVEKGFVHLTGISGEIPDGAFAISGHKDGTGASLQIMRYRPDSSVAQYAVQSHTAEPTAIPVALVGEDSNLDEDPF